MTTVTHSIKTNPPIQPDQVETFKVDPFSTDARNFELNQMFATLQASEVVCTAAARASEHEVGLLLLRNIAYIAHRMMKFCENSMMRIAMLCLIFPSTTQLAMPRPSAAVRNLSSV